MKRDELRQAAADAIRALQADDPTWLPDEWLAGWARKTPGYAIARLLSKYPALWKPEVWDHVTWIKEPGEEFVVMAESMHSDGWIIQSALPGRVVFCAREFELREYK